MSSQGHAVSFKVMSYSQWLWIATVVLQLLLLRSVAGQHTGLFLSLLGTPIDNDSFVDVDSIGASGSNPDNRLLCHTNATDCCSGAQGTAQGVWLLPDGTAPPTSTSLAGRTMGFSRERGQSVVRLYRRTNAPERGRFRCELLGDTAYVNILDIGSVSITSSAPLTVTAGQPVTLLCSVDIIVPAGIVTSTPVFEWFFGPTFNQPLTPTTTTNGGSTYTSTYSITSTRVSDEGMYTCRLRGNQRTARSTMVTVEPAPTTTPPPLPMVTASITASGTNTAGETYSLVCSVTVTGSTIQPTITWLADGVQITPEPSRTVSATTGDSNNGYSSTLTFNPLSASRAGTYTCRATLGSLNDEDTFTVQVNVPGVYIRQNNNVLANNSAVLISNIGRENNNRLECVTDRMPCCQSPALGNWFFPGGEVRVPALSPLPESFGRTRENDGTVNLHRVSNDVMMPTGRYCCVIPDAAGVLQWACVIIFSSITAEISDGEVTPTLGQSYTLTCTAIGTTFTSYQWRKDGSVISGETEPTLSFSSLTLTHAGGYSCGNGTLFSNNIVITLQVPRPASISLTSNTDSTDSGVVLLGSDVTLTCIVDLSSAVVDSDLILLMVDAQLSKDGAPLTLTGLTVTGTTFTYTIQLSSFDRRDAGNYTCTATVRPKPTSTHLTASGESVQADIAIMAGVPPPLNVEASQASPSDPVEVSWSPPSDGATTITGYRIFYGNGKNGSLPPVTVSLMLDINLIGQTVSVCTEAEQLASQCTNATVEDTDSSTASTSAKSSCTMETGIAVGVTVIVLLLVEVVIVITVVLCWWQRNKRFSTRLNKKDDFAVSANMAYGQVELGSTVRGELYEEPDRVVRSDQGHYELTEHPVNTTSPPAAPVYDTVGVA